MRGYFGIGIYGCKTVENVGTLWRSAYQLGAAFIFTIAGRYKGQASDTTKAYKHIPYYRFEDYEQFLKLIPYGCPVVGVEIGGKKLTGYTHFERCVYLLGSEDTGIPKALLTQLHGLIELPSVTMPSYNVAVAGSLVMYDRYIKRVK